MTSALTIAIAGAGIGGLAAGALLAQAGHQVTIYDQFDAPAPVGSGLVIQPVGVEVLKACGAAEAALGYGASITRMEGWEVEHGRKVLDVSYRPRGTGGSVGLGIHRASLFEALLQAARAAGVTLAPGHRAVASAPGAGVRALRFADGDAVQADLVIDASGARSPLSPLTGKVLPYGAVWATVPWRAETDLPPDRLSQKYWRAARMAGVLPIGTLPGGGPPQAAVFWSLPRAVMDNWPGPGGFAIWQQDVATFWPEAAPFFASAPGPEALTTARYTHGTLARPYAARLVHIGDAAHRASPQLGQGANMALLDAWALSLALAEAEGVVEDALPLYARLRRWHLWVYQLFSALFTPQYQSDSRVLPVLRDRALAPLSRIPPLPGVLSRLVSGTLLPPVRGHGPWL